jgi:predicted DNA-binding transcriptional regulator AlpA
MTEILTVAELPVMLKMSKAQVYEMTRERTRNGSMRDNPVPVLRINGNLRFRKADIEAWLESLVAQQTNDRITLSGPNYPGSLLAANLGSL